MGSQVPDDFHLDTFKEKKKKKGFSGKVLIKQELKCPVHQVKVKCDSSLLNAVHKGEMFLETMALKMLFKVTVG